MTAPTKLALSYDEAGDVLTVEGTKYSGEVFRQFGFGTAGRWMRVLSRDDGVVTVEVAATDLQADRDRLAAQVAGLVEALTDYVERHDVAQQGVNQFAVETRFIKCGCVFCQKARAALAAARKVQP
jgi:hypothetical protein